MANHLTPTLTLKAGEHLIRANTKIDGIFIVKEGQLKEVPKWLVALLKGVIHRLKITNEILRRNNLIDETINTKITSIENLNEKTK